MYIGSLVPAYAVFYLVGGGGGGGGGGEASPPKNKYHLATPFPVLKARAPPKIMRARRGLLIQRMRESEPTPFSETG